MTLSLCHSERSEESRKHPLDVTEILPPFSRLNDNFFILFQQLIVSIQQLLGCYEGSLTAVQHRLFLG